MPEFRLHTPYEPAGDQPQAIEALTKGVLAGARHQVLLGVTGSGKTFTIANVIARVQKPTLVISHNKTLAAQLYSEFKGFFPENAVEYFVSYYDYYQPEAYIPQTDTYIEKDASINDEIDRLRLSATASVLSRRDVIVVATVSCIYGIGSPEEHRKLLLRLSRGDEIPLHELLIQLVNMQYERNDIDFFRGCFRARGDVVEIFPAYAETAYRVEFFGNRVERLAQIDPLTGREIAELEGIAVYPASHWVTTRDRIEVALETIEIELTARLAELEREGKALEAQRLASRTRFDMEMLREVGYCQGIENYSRHLDGRRPGEPPHVLIDYFPEDYLLVIDESHVTIPQIRAMYGGDIARKETLVKHGFRLPSAKDNRPLSFEEFEARMGQTIYVSATPGPYELEKAQGRVVEQIIRPTGLVDPIVTVKPVAGQVDDLIAQIRKRVAKKQRVLVTTLTKRMAEDLAEYLSTLGFRVRYLHSEIETLERVEILRDLRAAKFDVLVGVNLLREGLDLPEVALVAILDADKEGFLRSQTSLVQVAGRCARNVDAEVIMYADVVTESMRKAIEETSRRRQIQLEYNKAHGITPRTIQKAIQDAISARLEADRTARRVVEEPRLSDIPDARRRLAELETEMYEAARRLEFERAAALRDEVMELRRLLGSKGESLAARVERGRGKGRRKGRRRC